MPPKHAIYQTVPLRPCLLETPTLSTPSRAVTHSTASLPGALSSHRHPHRSRTQLAEVTSSGDTWSGHQDIFLLDSGGQGDKSHFGGKEALFCIILQASQHNK